MAVADRFLVVYPAVVRYLRRRGAGDEADDLASQAVLKCLLAERRGQQINDSYFYAAAQSGLIDWHRRLKRQPAVSIERLSGAGWQVAAPEVSPDEGFEQLIPLSALPVRQRRALLLRASGMDQYEVAAAMGCSVYSVRGLWRLARQRLKPILRRTG